MKTISLTIYLLVAVFLVAPVATLAHSGTEEGTGFGMMQTLEDQALGDELHEEMEDLMGKMMSGNMLEAEAERMVELMDEYPGPQAMMMGRMMGAQLDNQPTGMMSGFNTMMPWGMSGNSGFWSLLIGLFYIVWAFVGGLAVIWLWKQITKYEK